VIARLELDYHAELTWPGQVEIGTRLLRLGRSSFTFAQGIFQNGRCAASAVTVIVLMNEATRRSTPLPPDLAQELERLGAKSGVT
jgi:acyl-CoA thioester hydrolase